METATTTTQGSLPLPLPQEPVGENLPTHLVGCSYTLSWFVLFSNTRSSILSLILFLFMIPTLFNIVFLSFRGVQSLFCSCVSATSQKSICSRKTVHVCSFSFSFNAALELLVIPVGLSIPSYEESNQLALQLSHKDVFRNALCLISLHLYLGQGLCAVPSFCIH